MTNQPLYTALNQHLKHEQIGINASELHGFLCGLLAAKTLDNSWQHLLNQMLNNDNAFSADAMKLIESFYNKSLDELKNDEFDFQILINDDDIFTRIDDFIGFVNHFLLGYGVSSLKFEHKNEQIKEALNDLTEISKLGYDDADDIEAISQQFEEVFEYVRIVVIFLYNEPNAVTPSNTIH